MQLCNRVPQNYKFTGKERDTESGLDNFGARYDSSNLGRFLTPDWAERPTAVPYAAFGDPQSLNLYGFVRNDPVSLADADGHACTDMSGPNAMAGCQNGEEQELAEGERAYVERISSGTKAAKAKEAQKMRIKIIFSSNLSDKQKARAMGLLGHAEYNLARLGIKTKEKSQTVTFDAGQIFSGKGAEKGAFNVFFGTNEDFGAMGSRSGKGTSFINVAKQGDDETILQFEMIQALTYTHGRIPVIGEVENMVKDFWYTPFLNAALDGTSRQMKVANVLTGGGFSEMKAQAEQYSGPDQ